MNKTSIIYTGTIITLIIFMTIMFITTSSISMIGYVTIGISLFISLILVLNNILSEIGFIGIILGLTIIFFHITLQSWAFTLSAAVMTALFILLKLKNRKWGNITLIGMVVILCFIFLAEGRQNLPEVTEDNIQSTVKKMENYNKISKVSVGLENDTIHCTLKVESSISESKKKILGEECAKVLASEAAKINNLKEPNGKYLGELYKYYIVELTIGTDGNEDDTIFERKYTNSNYFTW